MGRTSGNADKLMIAAAKEIIRKKGCSGLRVREVVDKARVNLGMFHYHFKNKQRFGDCLLQEFYEEFFGRLTLAVQAEKDPLVQLRNALLAVASFVNDENEFYLALIRDIVARDRQVLRFLQLNIPRHMQVFHELVERCQAEGKIVPMPFPQVMSFLMTSINFPIIIAYACMSRSAKKTSKEYSYVLTDKGIRQRVDMALKGLQP